MQQRSKFFGVVSLVLCVLGLAAFFLLHSEPSHQGKPLRAWLETGRDPLKRQEAIEAVRAIGPAALPHLARRLRSNRSKLIEMWYLLSIRLTGNARWVAPPTNQELFDAIFGFQAFGEQALPKLKSLLLSPDPRTRLNAMLCIAHSEQWTLGLVPELSNLLTNDVSPIHRGKAAETLGNVGSTEDIVAALTIALDDPDPKVRLRAALGLGRFDFGQLANGNMNAYMRLLWNDLFDGSFAPELGHLSSSTTNAIPSLARLLKDSNTNVAAAARFALSQIDKVREPAKRD